jgi:DNA polymerase (family 10)
MIATVALPRNQQVIDQLELLADMLELEGTEAFRVLAYRRAAQRIKETGGSIAQLALDGKAKELQGIGKTIEEKIVQIVETGEIEAVTKRRDRIPPDVITFMHCPASGRRPRAGSGKSSGSPRLPSCAQPPSRSGCARSPASGRRSRRTSSRR